MTGRPIPVMLLAALVAVPVPVRGPHGGMAYAQAQPTAQEKARTHFQRGQKLYAQQRYEEALDEYETAYEASPLPEILFNIGQCHRNLGHLDEAISAFEAYLAVRPDAANRRAVEKLVSELEKARTEAAARDAEKRRADETRADAQRREEDTRRADERRRTEADERQRADERRAQEERLQDEERRLAEERREEDRRREQRRQAAEVAAERSRQRLTVVPGDDGDDDERDEGAGSGNARWWLVGGAVAVAAGVAAFFLLSDDGIPGTSLGTVPFDE